MLVHTRHSDSMRVTSINRSNFKVLSKIFLTLLIVAMVASLFSALWFMIKDRGEGTRTVKALTVRVGIWVFLFALLGIGVYTGLIEPKNSLQPKIQTDQQ